MKVDCCDVCYYIHHRLVKSRWKTGFPGMKVDTCDEHKDVFAKMKKDDFVKAMAEMYSGKMPVVIKA